jgi:hypothetical protein
MHHARGPFACDARHGAGGECVYADGGRYAGAWRDDRRNGWGRMQLLDGTVYEGEWKDDARHGEGEAASWVGDWLGQQGPELAPGGSRAAVE